MCYSNIVEDETRGTEQPVSLLSERKRMNLTIGAWIVFGILAVSMIIAGMIIAYGIKHSWKNAIAGGFVGIILSAIVLLAMNWYYTSTAAGNRAVKSQQANFSKGIQRKVEVYDVNGNLIKEYTGKFDIEYDNDRILFDDENGKRHIIYYPTGAVIIDEVGAQ